MVMEAKDVKVGVYFRCRAYPNTVDFVGVITEIKNGVMFYNVLSGIDTETKHFHINSDFAKKSIILPKEIVKNLWLLEV